MLHCRRPNPILHFNVILEIKQPPPSRLHSPIKMTPNAFPLVFFVRRGKCELRIVFWTFRTKGHRLPLFRSECDTALLYFRWLQSLVSLLDRIKISARPFSCHFSLFLLLFDLFRFSADRPLLIAFLKRATLKKTPNKKRWGRGGLVTSKEQKGKYRFTSFVVECLKQYLLPFFIQDYSENKAHVTKGSSICNESTIFVRRTGTRLSFLISIGYSSMKDLNSEFVLYENDILWQVY